MAEPISIFDLIFPATGRELQATAAAVGAMPATPTTPVQTTIPVGVPAAPIRLQLGLRLSDIVAAYVAAQAPGIAERVAEELTTTVPAQQGALTSYTPPSGKTLILTAPLSMAARTHSAALAATVTVDSVSYPSTPMVEDDAIALAADAVIQRIASVEWVNGAWVDIDVVLAVQGIAVDSLVWAREILPLATAAYQALQARITQQVQGGTTP